MLRYPLSLRETHKQRSDTDTLKGFAEKFRRSSKADPKEVKAADLVGEWLLDSAIFNNEYGNYQKDRQLVTVRTNDLDVRDRKNSTYTVQNGIITVNYTKNEWEGVDDSYTAIYEIVSFDKGLKRAELKRHETYMDYSVKEEGEEVEGDMHYYLSILPGPTGKELAITEENIKGAWLCAYYEHYAEGEQGIKEVSPHFEFNFFGDNHKFAWLMGVNADQGYASTGFWWFKPGYMYMRVVYGDQTDLIHTRPVHAKRVVHHRQEIFAVRHFVFHGKDGIGL